MAESGWFRLRLRLSNGSELEAEGTAEFVQAEREAFLGQGREQAARTQAIEPAYPPPAWEQILETRQGGLQLRAKAPGKGEKDACLVLLAGAQKLLNTPKPTAAQIAKWLRASGYPISRVDRALAQALERGEILASGSRRARRYELTGPGRAKAFLLAEELIRIVTGQPSR